MSSLIKKFDSYCHDENNRGCENCQYNDGHDTDIIGCAMNFAYQQGREDAIDEAIKSIDDEYFDGGYGDYHEVAMIVRMLKQLKEIRHE